MLTPLLVADQADVWRAWDSYVPVRYGVPRQAIRANVLECPVLIPEASFGFWEDQRLVGWVASKAPSGEYEARDPDRAHLTALVFERVEVGRRLLVAALEALHELGYRSVQFGGDWRHFFAGSPTDWPEIDILLESYGLDVTVEVVDLVGDLDRYFGLPRELAPEFDGVEMRPCRRDDWSRVERFLAREFPGRWRADARAKWEAEPEPAFMHGLFVEGDCEGFAITQRRNCKLPIAGMVWAPELFEVPWAALGPIGLSKEVRGHGLGDALLSNALLALKREGVRRCLIDWTTLGEFYKRHGFKVFTTYRQRVIRFP